MSSHACAKAAVCSALLLAAPLYGEALTATKEDAGANVYSDRLDFGAGYVQVQGGDFGAVVLHPTVLHWDVIEVSRPDGLTFGLFGEGLVDSDIGVRWQLGQAALAVGYGAGLPPIGSAGGALAVSAFGGYALMNAKGGFAYDNCSRLDCAGGGTYRGIGNETGVSRGYAVGARLSYTYFTGSGLGASAGATCSTADLGTTTSQQDHADAHWRNPPSNQPLHLTMASVYGGVAYNL